MGYEHKMPIKKFDNQALKNH